MVMVATLYLRSIIYFMLLVISNYKMYKQCIPTCYPDIPINLHSEDRQSTMIHLSAVLALVGTFLPLATAKYR